MKIAFIVPTFPSVSETFIARQVTGLRALGHQVDIFAENAPPLSLAPADVSVRYINGRGKASLPGVAILAARLAMRAPAALHFLGRDASKAYGGRRELLPRLGIAFAQGPYDIVHCHFGPIGLRYRFAAELWNAPLVVSFYGHDCSRFPLRNPPGVYAPLFASAARVIILSDEMGDRLLELGCPPELLRKVPVSVDTSEWRFQPPVQRLAPGSARILTVARLVEKKGIEYALRAIASLAVAFPGLTYDVVGDGELRGSLERLARDLGLAHRVVFHGAADGLAIRQFMRDADVFLLPSVTASDGDREGTPTVLTEAAALGLPILSTRHSGIPEMIEHERTGLLVGERDSVGLAAALRLLLGDAELRRKLAFAARHDVELRYDSGVLNRRLADLYGELVLNAPRYAARKSAPAVASR
ncbi:MAG: glycosyltransferase [Gemmatimonadota bacterium]